MGEGGTVDAHAHVKIHSYMGRWSSPSVGRTDRLA